MNADTCMSCADVLQPAPRETTERSLIGRLEQHVVVLADAMIDKLESRRSRARLYTLDDRMLRDLGISRTDIQRFV